MFHGGIGIRGRFGAKSDPTAPSGDRDWRVLGKNNGILNILFFLNDILMGLILRECFGWNCRTEELLEVRGIHQTKTRCQRILGFNISQRSKISPRKTKPEFFPFLDIPWIASNPSNHPQKSWRSSSSQISVLLPKLRKFWGFFLGNQLQPIKRLPKNKN